jgi:hypothetical protein
MVQDLHGHVSGTWKLSKIWKPYEKFVMRINGEPFVLERWVFFFDTA